MYKIMSSPPHGVRTFITLSPESFENKRSEAARSAAAKPDTNSNQALRNEESASPRSRSHSRSQSQSVSQTGSPSRARSRSPSLTQPLAQSRSGSRSGSHSPTRSLSRTRSNSLSDSDSSFSKPDTKGEDANRDANRDANANANANADTNASGNPSANYNATEASSVADNSMADSSMADSSSIADSSMADSSMIDHNSSSNSSSSNSSSGSGSGRAVDKGGNPNDTRHSQALLMDSSFTSESSSSQELQLSRASRSRSHHNTHHHHHHHHHHNAERDIKEAPRKRRRTSPNELHILETEFSVNSKPCKEDRERIASLTSMDEKAVQVWFQNKRQSYRRQQSQGNITAPAIVRTHSMPVFQDENTFQVGVHSVDLNNRKPFGPVADMPLVAPVSTQPTFSIAQAKANSGVSAAAAAAAGTVSKGLKLSMSADGKAELVERSPLKQLHTNHNHNHHHNGRAQSSMGYSLAPPPPQAVRFATMPALTPQLTGVEQECASSLLVLKSGQWR